MIVVDKEIKLYTVANGVPWVYLEKYGGKEGPVALFGSLLRPMGASLLSPLMLASLPSFLGRE